MRLSESAIFTTVHSGERGESADRRQAHHSSEESLLPAQSFFAHSRTGRPVHELSSLSSRREKPCREIEDETISFLLERQEEHILADFRAEIQKHEFQADSENLREAHMKSLDEMELKRFQGSTFDESLNSRPEFRNYRMKLIVCMIREIF